MSNQEILRQGIVDYMATHKHWGETSLRMRAKLYADLVNKTERFRGTAAQNTALLRILVERDTKLAAMSPLPERKPAPPRETALASVEEAPAMTQPATPTPAPVLVAAAANPLPTSVAAGAETTAPRSVIADARTVNGGRFAPPIPARGAVAGSVVPASASVSAMSAAASAPTTGMQTAGIMAPASPRAPELRERTIGERVLENAGKYLGHPFDTLPIPQRNGTHKLVDGLARVRWERDGTTPIYDKMLNGVSNDAAWKPHAAVISHTEKEPFVCIDLPVRSWMDTGILPRNFSPSSDSFDLRRVAFVEKMVARMPERFEVFRPNAKFESILDGTARLPRVKAGDTILVRYPGGGAHSGIVASVDARGNPLTIRAASSEGGVMDKPFLPIPDTRQTTGPKAGYVPASGFIWPTGTITSIVRARDTAPASPRPGRPSSTTVADLGETI